MATVDLGDDASASTNEERNSKGALAESWKKTKEAWKILSGTPRVLKLVWEAHKGLALALVFLNVTLGLAPFAQIWMTKLLVDAVAASVTRAIASSITFSALLSGSSDTNYVLMLILSMVLIRLVTSVLDPTARLVQQHLGDYLTCEVNKRILLKANRLVDISVFETPKFYDMLQQAQNEASYRPLNMLLHITQSMRCCIGLLSMVLVVVAFQPLLALLVVVVSLPQIFVQFRNQWESWAMASWMTPEVRRMRYFSNVLTNSWDAKEVRVFGLGDYFVNLYLSKFWDFRKRQSDLRTKHWRRGMLLAGLGAAGIGIAYAYIAWRAIIGAITIGSLTLYWGAISSIEDNLLQLFWGIAELYEGNLFVNHVFDFLNIPEVMPQVALSEAHPLSVPLKEGIEFRHVAFSYANAERAVLEDVSFTVKPGETVALVGENGAGKTTLVKLLARLYDPTGGEILIDGVDLKQYDLSMWRSKIAVVFQDYCRFHMTARENIGVGQVEDIHKEEIVHAAAARGGATKVIERLASGLETTLGRWFVGEDEGAELSGGEWQKIALSRAFMRSSDGNGQTPAANSDDDNHREIFPQAQILILDEPTASLDVQSEYDVYLRFSELTKGKTTLLISHRFSTVRMADKILVLEHGKIIEHGSHEELLALDGTYKRLYHLQADRYK